MKILPVVTIVLISIIIMLASGSCAGPEGAVPEDNSEWADVLAQRFSPVILLKNDEEPAEKYEPVPVQAMIEQSLILSMDNSSFAEKATIANMLRYSGSSYFLDIPELSPAHFLLSLLGYKERYDQALASGLSPTVYARVLKPGDSGYTVIQYWYFYYFDEWSNLHEGDWELVELVFSGLSAQELVEANGEPLFAAYSQHQAGQRLSWAEMREKGLIRDTHPLVYVAQGSHANYFTPGQYWLITDFDDTGLKDWREVSPQLVMISEQDPENDKNQWLDFQGCWGEYLDFSISWGPLIWTQCGPNGPAWGGTEQKSARWRQPFPWADKMAEYPQAYFYTFLPKLARDLPDLSIFSLFSPADIHVYDRHGNHAGLNEAGVFETRIPGAEYITPEGAHSKTIIIPNSDVSEGYTLIIKGNDNGSMDIKTQIPDARKSVKRYVEYRGIPVTPTTVARLQFTETPFAPPLKNSDNVRDNITILEIDRNNDGIYESEVKPGTSEIESKPTLTLKVEGAGSARAVKGYTYQKNAKAAIIAEPEEGWIFDRWGGDASGTFASLNIVMDRDKTIIAYFKPERRLYTLTIGIEGKGTTNPEPGTYSFIEGGIAEIQTLPGEGHKFIGWSGNYGDDPTLKLTIDRDIEVVAIFHPRETGPVLEQANEPPWDGAWMNISPENQVGQSIVTIYDFLEAVEVNILTGNAGRGGDIITMNILYEGEKLIASVSQYVEEGFDGWLRFEMTKEGIGVPAGTNLIIQLEDTGKIVFGWKYDGDTYPLGIRFFFGEAQEGDFFFRTYGTTAE